MQRAATSSVNLKRPDPGAPVAIARWEDPPPPPRRGGRHPKTVPVETLAELKRNRGKWALIKFYSCSKTFNAAGAAALRAKKQADAVGFDFVGRRCPDGKRSALYGRYVGA